MDRDLLDLRLCRFDGAELFLDASIGQFAGDDQQGVRILIVAKFLHEGNFGTRGLQRRLPRRGAVDRDEMRGQLVGQPIQLCLFDLGHRVTKVARPKLSTLSQPLAKA